MYKEKEKKKSWVEAWTVGAAGLGFIVFSLVGSVKTNECAIIGVGLLMQPLLEVAMVRHVRYFVDRATMVSESFDRVRRLLDDRVGDLEKWRREEVDPALKTQR